MGKKLTTEEFIAKSIIKHNDKYDYSLVNYINNRTKVKIICSRHGVFEQIANSHLNGQGCKSCNFGGKIDEVEVLNRIKKVHKNKYEYDLTNYNGVDQKIGIICSEHGEFKQRIIDHINGTGCPKCVGRNKTNEDFIIESNLIHGDRFDYSLSEYINHKSKVKIICPSHGEFQQSPNAHLNGQGCPICKESKGEKEIREYLKKNKIKFINQHKFPKCKNIKPLPFDFYLPDYNTCIEFNGRQHYEPVTAFGGEKEFKKVKLRDKIKKDYCLDNNIKLVIVSKNDNITDIIKTICKN